MPDHLKIRIIKQMDHVLLASGEIVVETDHFIAFIKQPLTQVGTYKACPPGN
jgi:hypothetical protein